MTIRPSPIVALNRAIAVSQDQGPERGLQEIHAIADRDRLSRYPFYFAALGELELRCGHRETAHQHFGDALARARNPMEREFFQQRMRAWTPCIAARSVAWIDESRLSQSVASSPF